MDTNDKSIVRQYKHNDHRPDNAPAVLATPLRLSGALLSKGTRRIRPWAPQLITISVCLLLVPLVVFLSLFAGWYVWKNVAVGWEASVHLQYGDGLPPWAEIQLPSLVAQQTYDISLRLAVPATESNYALGNFMTTLTLSSTSNKTLASIRRSSIAVPAGSRSFWTSQPNVVDITVPLFSSFAPGTSHVIAKLEVGRQDGWKSLGAGHGRELSVLSASLRGSIKRAGLRGLITRFPLISAVISSIIFLAISLFVLAVFFLPALRWTSSSSPESEIQPLPEMPQTQRQGEKQRAELSDDSDDGDEKKSLRRRRRSSASASLRARSDSHSRRLPVSGADVKTESSSTVIPEASVGTNRRTSTPLRRRRSRLSQNLSDEDS